MIDYSKLKDYGNPLTLQEGLIEEHKKAKSTDKKRLLERAIAYIREHEGLNKDHPDCCNQVKEKHACSKCGKLLTVTVPPYQRKTMREQNKLCTC